MISVEAYQDKYLPDLYRISLATGHLGGDASGLYDDPKMMGHIYSAPYGTLEPSLVLLAMDEQGVAGFALGAADTQAWEDKLEREWWPRLRSHYQDPSDLPPTEWTQDQRRAHMIHHPARVLPEVSSQYPAHMHMNLLPRVQGAGVGSRLLEAWFDLLAPLGPKAVHVGVNRQNEKAVRFWSRSGFDEIRLAAAEPDRTLWMGRRLSRPRPSSTQEP